MDHWFLILSTLCFFFGFAWSLLALGAGISRPSRWSFTVMFVGFLLQTGFLHLRGQAVGRCPVTNLFEVLMFLSWAIVLIYFVVGGTYRLSLLGMFTAPMVFLLQFVAQLLPVARLEPVYKKSGGMWPELHAAVSLVAYGAFALGCVAGVMYLVQERLLKRHRFNSFFENLPPIADLAVALQRVVFAGFVLLSLGLIAGFFAGHTAIATIVLAVMVWLPYGLLLLAKMGRRMSSRRIAWFSIVAFVLALGGLGALSFFHL